MTFLNLRIEIPDDALTIEESHFSFMSEGLEAEVIPVLLLAAAEMTTRSELAMNLSRENPHASGDTLDALIILNARLKLLDEVMHLPMTPSEGMISPM